MMLPLPPPSSQLRPQPCKGFTLVELMVVIAVGATLSLLAAPSFMQLIDRNRADTVAQNFANDLQFARSEALRQGLPVTLRAYSNAATDQYGQFGWVIFTDEDGDNLLDNGGELDKDNDGRTDEKLLRKSNPTPKGMQLVRRDANQEELDNGESNYVIFNKKGELMSGSTTHFEASSNSKATLIQISVSGLITTKITDDHLNNNNNGNNNNNNSNSNGTSNETSNGTSNETSNETSNWNGKGNSKGNGKGENKGNNKGNNNNGKNKS